jgi:hypothetical protein
MRCSARSFGIAYRNKASRGPTQAKLAERFAHFQTHNALEAALA